MLRVSGVVAACVVSLLSFALLTGCGTNGALASGCLVQDIPADTATSGSHFAASFAHSSVTLYPGQTIGVDVALQSKDAAQAPAEPVTVRLANLPPGITSSSVVAYPGSTAHLSLSAGLSPASSCFTGERGVFSAQLPLTAEAISTSGSSTAHSLLEIQLDNPSFTPASVDLPVIRIDTANSVPVDQEDDYVSAHMSVADSDDPSDTYSGTLGIKGHGNSTWEMPKKPFRLKLDSKSKLLGMKSAKNWVLLANYDDKALIRTDVAFHVSNIFGMAWTPSTAFAELFLNGQYQGVYQLSEKVEVGSNRLDIGEMDEGDIAGDALTGGYLGEIDSYMGATFNFTSPGGLPISLDDPDPPASEQADYFAAQFKAAENSIFSNAFKDADSGWRAHWDQGSMVNWFLTEEFMGNEDADFFSSDYFYKPHGDSRFYMGPVWDFDISSGNVNYNGAQNATKPWVSTQASWFARLLQDPDFLAAVKAQWLARRSQVGELASYIDARSAALQKGAANNYGRWPTLGEKVWPNVVAEGTYQGEVDFLKQWLAQRTAYMDAQYGQ